MLKIHVILVAINKVSYFVSKCLIRPICFNDILVYPTSTTYSYTKMFQLYLQY